MRPDSQPAPVPPTPTVLKFGGAGLADGERVARACRLVGERGGERPVIVVSAVGEVTALLDTAACAAARGSPDAGPVRRRHKRLLTELGLEPGLLLRQLAELEALLAGVAAARACAAAQRDHVLALGERMSARLFAAALRARGVEATPVDAFDLGLVSDSNHGRAAPRLEALPGVGRALARLRGVPVVTGFVAADEHGRLTTLGRSGSDLSAALLAEAVGAREVQLWKTVGGVMSADPELVPDARSLPRLTYGQAAALAFHGAAVLHRDALAPLRRAAVPARVLDLGHPQRSGTLIGPDGPQRGLLGVSCRRGADVAGAGSPSGGPGQVALIAAAATELDVAAAARVLARAGVDAPRPHLDVPHAAAVWSLPTSRLQVAARALHALALATHEPEPVTTRSAP